jgi:hypothetical protein
MNDFLEVDAEKCSSSRNFLHRFQCERVRSSLKHFIGDHFGKVSLILFCNSLRIK